MAERAKLESVPPQPEPDPPEVRRIELAGKYAGQWVECRTVPTIGEFRDLMSGNNGRVYVAAASMVVGHSFGGKFDDQPLPVLNAVVAAWSKQAEDAALDPTPAVD
jgi:hypothetical protein